MIGMIRIIIFIFFTRSIIVIFYTIHPSEVSTTPSTKGRVGGFWAVLESFRVQGNMLLGGSGI